MIVRRWAGKFVTLQWRHNGRDSVSNHHPHDCLLNRLFWRRSKKTSKLCVTGLCAGNSPGTGEFPAQMASYAENVSIWWRHHDSGMFRLFFCACWITENTHVSSFKKIYLKMLSVKWRPFCFGQRASRYGSWRHWQPLKCYSRLVCILTTIKPVVTWIFYCKGLHD